MLLKQKCKGPSANDAMQRKELTCPTKGARGGGRIITFYMSFNVIHSFFFWVSIFLFVNRSEREFTKLIDTLYRGGREVSNMQ